jgi:hypothetical protein
MLSLLQIMQKQLHRVLGWNGGQPQELTKQEVDKIYQQMMIDNGYVLITNDGATPYWIEA